MTSAHGTATILALIFTVLMALPVRATVLRTDFVDAYKVGDMSPAEAAAWLRKHQRDATRVRVRGGTLSPADWKVLETMPKLEELSVFQATTSDLASISRLKRVRKLSLSSLQLTYDALARVKPLPNITALHLDCSSCKNVACEVNLSAFPSLTSISLYDAPGQSQVNLLSILPYASKLVELSVSCGTMSHQKVFGRLKLLKRMTIWFPDFDEQGSMAIGELQNLEELILCDTGLTELSYKQIGRLQRLKKLELKNSHIPGFAFRHIGKLRQLEEIEISFGTYKDSDLLPLANLRSLRRMRFFSGQPVAGAFLANFKGIPLEYLYLNGEKLDEQGIINISQLGSLKTLGFETYKSGPKASWGKHLSRLSNLENLWVSCPAEHADLWAQEIGKLKELKNLKLEHSDLTNSGVHAIANLHNLESLTLAKTHATGACLKDLSANHPKLKQLTLTGCRITDAHLAGINGLPDLEMLELDETEITDDGLANLQNLPQLKVLALDRTKVSGSGLRSLKKFPLLENLGLCGTEVTSEGLANLSVAMNISSLDVSDTEVNEHALTFLKSMPKLEHLYASGCGFLNTKSGWFQKVTSGMTAEAEFRSRRPEEHQSKVELEVQLRKTWWELLLDQSGYSHKKYALLLVKLGRYKESLPYFETAIYNIQHPKHFHDCDTSHTVYEMFETRAHVYNELGRYAEALKDANNAVGLRRLFLAARKERANANMNLGRFEQALTDLNRLIEINPRYAEAYRLRGQVYRKMGRIADAASDEATAQKIGHQK